MLRPIGSCKICNGHSYSLSVTRRDTFTIDAAGQLDDKDGTDYVSTLACKSCGTIAIESGSYTEEESAAIFQELERQVLET